MTEEQQTEHDSDYQSLVALFIQLLKSLHNDDKDEALYALSRLLPLEQAEPPLSWKPD